MVNPNPARITDEMWRLWTDRPNLSWQLSGIYADKKGYHNTVIRNIEKWPGNYTIKLPLDLPQSNRDKARAIDLTMTPAEMIKWTLRMKKSAADPADNRLAAVKEFYGTLDGKTVFGRSKDTTGKDWQPSSADLTHLWHGHTSIFTLFVSDWQALAPIISVWAGVSNEDWKSQEMLITQGSSGEEVKYWQYVHNAVIDTVNPPSVKLKVDGIYGVTTAKAFADFVHKQGGQEAYNGQSIFGWTAIRYHTALIRASVPKGETPELPEDYLKELVTAWMSANVKGEIKIDGNLKGTILL